MLEIEKLISTTSSLIDKNLVKKICCLFSFNPVILFNSLNKIVINSIKKAEL
jgi:hypothetical protein